MFETILVIACGGALGSVLRFLLSSGIELVFEREYFPLGIFACNVLGSFVIGILSGAMLKKSEPSELWRYFLVVGLCGGFTTFSSFSLDNLVLLRHGAVGTFFLNVILSVVVCLLMTYVGFEIASKV